MARGGLAGSAGSLMYQRCTCELSTLAMSSALPSGAHQ
jgi:hypothetical protein